MGNLATTTTPLPNTWQRINQKFLKNIHTQEVIQEHLIIHHTTQQQNYFITLLKHRLSLHHPYLLKVIYYKHATDQSFCNSILNRHKTYVYTEYPGDSLADFAADRSKDIQIYSFSQIIAACQYLQRHYGWFRLSEGMIFVGREGETSIKLWINSRVLLCQREMPCSEEQMCRSIQYVFQFMRNNRIATSLDKDQVDYLRNINNLMEMKSYILSNTNKQNSNPQTRSKKAHSLMSNQHNYYHQPQIQLSDAHQFPLNHIDRPSSAISLDKPRRQQQQYEKYYQGKINFQYKTPKIEQYSVIQPLMMPLTTKNKVMYNENISQPSFTKITTEKALENVIFNKPQRAGNVKFVFTDRQRHAETQRNPAILQLQKYRIDRQQIQKNIQHKAKPYEQQKKIYQEQQRAYIQQHQSKAISFYKSEGQTLFSHNIGTYATSIQNSFKNSLNNSPQIPRVVLENPLILKQKPDLQLKQHNGKNDKPTALATTSRTPYPKIKENISQRSAKERQRPSELKNITKQHFVKPTLVKQKQNNNKFQKFKNAIKKYEQRLREKIRIEGSNLSKRNKANIKQKIDDLIEVPTNKSCKETKSLYNDSSKEKMDHEQNIDHERTYLVQIQSQNIIEQDLQITKKLKVSMKDAHSITDSQEIKEQINKDNKDNMEQSQFKNDFDEDYNEGNASVTAEERKSLMKEQYRSIRQKVKQKKETFAQFKAEAAKILEDFSF